MRNEAVPGWVDLDVELQPDEVHLAIEVDVNYDSAKGGITETGRIVIRETGQKVADILSSNFEMSQDIDPWNTWDGPRFFAGPVRCILTLSLESLAIIQSGMVIDTDGGIRARELPSGDRAGRGNDAGVIDVSSFDAHGAGRTDGPDGRDAGGNQDSKGGRRPALGPAATDRPE